MCPGSNPVLRPMQASGLSSSPTLTAISASLSTASRVLVCKSFAFDPRGSGGSGPRFRNYGWESIAWYCRSLTRPLTLIGVLGCLHSRLWDKGERIHRPYAKATLNLVDDRKRSWSYKLGSALRHWNLRFLLFFKVRFKEVKKGLCHSFVGSVKHIWLRSENRGSESLLISTGGISKYSFDEKTIAV
jgi:hypothetical protein